MAELGLQLNYNCLLPNIPNYRIAQCLKPTTAEVIPYYVSPSQIAAILPSATFPFSPTTPTGTLLVQYFTYPARFTATGLDHGTIAFQSYSQTIVHY